MRVLPFLILFNGLVCAAPQNILSDIKSVLGFPDDKTTSTAPKTLAPPITASIATPKSTKDTHTNSATVSTSTATSKPKSTKTTDSSSDESSTSTDSTTDSSTITTAPTVTTTNLPSPTITPTSTPTAIANDPSQSSSSNNVPAGGIAVAVIMSLLVLAFIAWLIFRYHPGVRKRWLARQEKKMQERSYREAIDGPFTRGGAGVRNAALSSPSVSSRKSMLQSFFAPRTVKLGNGQEIRRKPVNWGATNEPVPPLPGMGPGMEKVALTNMAAPMARSESMKSGVSYLSRSGSNGGLVSGVPSPAVQQKELPPMPELPAVAELPPNTVPPRLSPLPPLSPIMSSPRLSQLPELSPMTAPSRASPSPALSPVSALSRTPSIAELATPAVPPRKPVPKMPPMPPIPAEPQGDMHKILSRKSIFELA